MSTDHRTLAKMYINIIKHVRNTIRQNTNIRLYWWRVRNVKRLADDNVQYVWSYKKQQPTVTLVTYESLCLNWQKTQRPVLNSSLVKALRLPYSNHRYELTQVAKTRQKAFITVWTCKYIMFSVLFFSVTQSADCCLLTSTFGKHSSSLPQHLFKRSGTPLASLTLCEADWCEEHCPVQQWWWWKWLEMYICHGFSSEKIRLKESTDINKIRNIFLVFYRGTSQHCVSTSACSLHRKLLQKGAI